MNIIKNLDYDRYNKYINQKYLEERNFEIFPTIFMFLCFLLFCYWTIGRPFDINFIVFLILSFYGFMENIAYYFFYKKTVFGIFFLDNRLALKFSPFQYEYLENIEKIDTKKSTLLNKIISHYAYDTISISSNHKTYLIPYNTEFKDELIEILSKYQIDNST